MKPYRIFIEKRKGFRTEAERLRRDLNNNLNLNLKNLRLLSVYDLFGFPEELVADSSYKVFAEPATDEYFPGIDLDGKKHLAFEYLPGQFDQRAASAEACVNLIDPNAQVTIRSGRLMIFDDDISEDDIKKIADYCINPVDSRIKDLSILSLPGNSLPSEEEVLDGFLEITEDQAQDYCTANGLAMNGDDLMKVVEYFRNEKRNPNKAELKILDTYWSDHCRHTTFNTKLEDIAIEPSPYSDSLEATLNEWLRIRKETGREHKPMSLMDLATISARYLEQTGALDNLEKSEENNACSVVVDIDVDGEMQKWLLQFKNETHNHPTEIEPYGGASTCIGGAVRDPLSGRAYVYQAMRVTGSGDIHTPVDETLAGKLPQRLISIKAAAGYSSYGNQLGLATTHVKEIFHPGYVAKRMEVGAVVGAVKQSEVVRKSPEAGDVIIMLGGRTGRDGIGGATGSSKQHTEESLQECGSEVQKGNPPEERKIQRLFRRPEVAAMIKKSNDFGAGGVSVAIGELAPGLDIYLDRIKLKYSGLSASEIAISESQERMAVVVEKKDVDKFIDFCKEENIEAVHVADVTDTGRMKMYMNGSCIADLSREFIDSAGAPRRVSPIVKAPEGKQDSSRLFRDVFKLTEEDSGKDAVKKILQHPNVVTQKGLVEMFDSTIGASTVLMPYGGKTQRTESQVSVQKFPVGNAFTDSASLMAFGFNPFMSDWSPYHGAAVAVVESVAKAVAAGAKYSDIRLTFQEYFERMSSREAWGKPLAALLGAFKMQLGFSIAAIGGKDSMSGTFGNINVPPTLISFAVAPVKASLVVSSEFKKGGSNLYLLRGELLVDGLPDVEKLKVAFSDYHERVEKKEILSAYAIGFGGLVEAAAKMSFGNNIGADITLKETELPGWEYGSILIETDSELPETIYTKIGVTIEKAVVSINGNEFDTDYLYEVNSAGFSNVYPDKTESGTDSGFDFNVQAKSAITPKIAPPEKIVENPVVFLPVFPGTNCDYDMSDAFEREGARPVISVYRNQTPEDILQSTEEMVRNIEECHILALSGGFSAGDEPDGSGKFIANILMESRVRNAIERLLERGGLVLGICNGFQALIKSGLLPFGKIGELSEDSPTLMRNDINRHISQMVSTRVSTTASPWLWQFSEGELFTVAASHGEGKFVAPAPLLKTLAENGQIAFQYVDPATGLPTMESPYNPNGSLLAIEGIISPDGKILGKMAHSERYKKGLMKNIHGNKDQNIFRNAVGYFRGQTK